MHIFFGILKTNSISTPESHWDCLHILDQKFPTSFLRGQSFSTDLLDLKGDISRSTIPGRSDLYLCGETYNTDDLAPETGTDSAQLVKALHARIESHGLHATVSALNGRFMLCYLDHATGEVHILTDHMGIQQVFYHKGNGFLLFGSEIKFLLNHPLCPRAIDWHYALRRSLPFEVLDGEKNYHSWFKDIYLLEEATDLCTDLKTGACAKHAYWNPYATAPATGARNTQQFMDEYMNLLEDAVRIRIRDGDTAFSFLSGGLDSSIICALAAREKPLETFSIITQTTMLEDTSEMCFRLAHDLQFKNTQFVVPYHRIIFDAALWKKGVWRAESPYNHTDSLTKTLLHDAIRRHDPQIGYTLTGTGSDQMNGGLARWIVEDADTPEERWQNLIGKVAEAEHRYHLPERQHTLWSTRTFLHRDFITEISSQPLEPNPWLYYVKSNIHINKFVLQWDENHAAYSHRHSARYPFLDHRFVAFIATIPEHLHGELFYDKQILRNPSARYLPEYILNKPKAPANTGMYDQRFELYQFLINPHKLDLFEQALGPLNESHPVIDKKALLAELERLTKQPGHSDWQYLLHIINLGLLEKLPAQDEVSMRYEDEVQQVMETVTELTPPIKARISRELDIVPEDELLRKPLQFAPGCSLVTEHPGGKVYINKNEILVYELEDDNPEWRNFLFAIDNNRPTVEILETIHADFEKIREYFYICLKEAILQVQ